MLSKFLSIQLLGSEQILEHVISSTKLEANIFIPASLVYDMNDFR